MAESIQELVERGRKACEAIKDYTQEQIDEIVFEVAKTGYEHAEELAKMTVEETGLGVVDHKIDGLTGQLADIWMHLKDKKSVGIIDEKADDEGLIRVAHPKGVVASITPATSPAPTALGNFMQAVKGKNAVIVSSAPRAEQTSIKTVQYARETLKRLGAPEDLIQIVTEVSIPKSQELMAECDLVVATGSTGLTKAAYSSGTPALAVGAGNTPVILDHDYDLDAAAIDSVESIGGDNGMYCDGNNTLFYPKDIEADWFAAMERHNMKVFTDPADVEKVRRVLFDENDDLVSDMVGRDAWKIAEAAGIEIPDGTEIIGLKVDEIGAAEILCKEVLCPVVVLKSYDTFEEAVDLAMKNMDERGGKGHTAGIFSHDMDHILYYGERIPVSRVIINQPTPNACGPNCNGLVPSVSEGCGSWGNNILSENVDYIHMINVSRIAFPLDRPLNDPDEIFG